MSHLHVELPGEGAQIPNSAHNPGLRERRKGVMLHYDASASDPGAVSWLADPCCRVSYNDLVLDDGTRRPIVSWANRAWHAGVCRPSKPQQLEYRDANSAFIGIAAATNAGETATIQQLLTIVFLCRLAFTKYGWDLRETFRIVGHDMEAWNRGRKVDPTGPNAKRPILSVETVRYLVQRLEV